MSALWTPADLRAATGGLLRTPFSASGVSIDTRTLKPGDLFVALVGESDGHRWVRWIVARPVRWFMRCRRMSPMMRRCSR